MHCFFIFVLNGSLYIISVFKSTHCCDLSHLLTQDYNMIIARVCWNISYLRVITERSAQSFSLSLSGMKRLWRKTKWAKTMTYWKNYINIWTKLENTNKVKIVYEPVQTGHFIVHWQRYVRYIFISRRFIYWDRYVYSWFPLRSYI